MFKNKDEKVLKNKHLCKLNKIWVLKYSVIKTLQAQILIQTPMMELSPCV